MVHDRDPFGNEIFGMVQSDIIRVMSLKPILRQFMTDMGSLRH